MPVEECVLYGTIIGGLAYIFLSWLDGKLTMMYLAHEFGQDVIEKIMEGKK